MVRLKGALIWIAVATALSTAMEPAQEGSLEKALVVLEHGDVQRLDKEWNVRGTADTSWLRSSRGVRAADITPDGKLLILAVSGEESPIVVLQTHTLTPAELGPISLPGPPKAWSRHEPLMLVALTSNKVLYSDECYTAAEQRFSDMIVDLASGKVCPLARAPGGAKHTMWTSPTGDRLLSADGERVTLLELGGGATVFTWKMTDEGWARIQRGNVDWASGRAEFVCTLHGGGREGEPTVRVSFDLKTGARTVSESQPVAEYEGLDPQGRLFEVLRAYERGLCAWSSGLPVLNKELESFLTYCERQEVVGLVPANLKLAFLSKDGRYLFAVHHWVATTDTGREKDVSTLRVIDCARGELVKTIDFDSSIVSIFASWQLVGTDDK